SDIVSAEALRRAERTGNPITIQMAVTTASSRHLYRTARLDCAASLAILSAYDETSRIDAEIALWLDIQWGAAFVRLHQSGAVGRLARAARAADRQGALNVECRAVRMLATAVSQAGGGWERQADMLIGYGNANLLAFGIEEPGYAWIQDLLDAALAGAPDRERWQAEGARLTRPEMQAYGRDCGANIAAS